MKKPNKNEDKQNLKSVEKKQQQQLKSPEEKLKSQNESNIPDFLLKELKLKQMNQDNNSGKSEQMQSGKSENQFQLNQSVKKEVMNLRLPIPENLLAATPVRRYKQYTEDSLQQVRRNRRNFVLKNSFSLKSNM